MTTKREVTLVLGGTGNIGRRVAQRLTERGIPIRIGSRSGEPPFDWNDRDTWAPDDVADVVVAALTDGRHAGEVYEPTGPRLLTFAEAVAEIARAAGREVRYVRISVDEYASMLAGLDVPAAASQGVWQP